MSHHSRLRALFRSAVGAAVAAGAAGCGDAGIDKEPFTLSVCTGDQYEPLAGVTPATPVDYLELRLQFDEQNGAGTSTVTTSAKTGTLCKTATDKAKCEAAVANLRAPSGLRPLDMAQPPDHTYLVFTRGDDVAGVAQKDIAKFIGPIDNIKDAALMAHLAGHRLVCLDVGVSSMIDASTPPSVSESNGIAPVSSR